MGETRRVFEGFFAHDPGGCMVAEKHGERTGICVATAYRRSGFIGELVVTKNHRGHGIGRALFERAIAYLKSKAVEAIYLDGDLDAVPFYERTGFKKLCRSLRFIGGADGETAVENDGPGVTTAPDERDVELVVDLDRRLFGDNRGFFLRRRMEEFAGFNFVSKRDGDVTGYILAQPGIGVLSVGPWAVLEADADATLLLDAVARAGRGTPLRLGVLEWSGNAVAVLESAGTFAPQTPCWRMVMGSPATALGSDPRLFAIGSAAKG